MRLARLTAVAVAVVATAAVVGAAALAVPGNAVAGKAPKPKVVSLWDDYFSPESVTVRKGGRVNWVWRGVEDHDVTLRKGPKGVKKGQWRSAATSVTGSHWTRTFKIRGTYKFWCTLHPSAMNMTVTVKK